MCELEIKQCLNPLRELKWPISNERFKPIAYINHQLIGIQQISTDAHFVQ
jgi:hypothetical protein